jgi:hypothetical protein
VNGSKNIKQKLMRQKYRPKQLVGSKRLPSAPGVHRHFFAFGFNPK